MNDATDQELLRDYAERRSEPAFATIVHRYTDLVYSAALRMICDADAARDVTQSVFIALARNARQLTDRPSLAGWLHTTTRNLAAKSVRADAHRRGREQEAAVMNQLLSAEADASWETIAPLLDHALGELSESDREALLLRYFKNHDLRTIGALLGISDDAAQKRVSRAVEKLREFFSKRNITVGAGGLTVVISANAVQSAPVGLAAAISAAATLAGINAAATATATATKVIAMTTLQKAVVTATLTAAIGAGIYEAHQASQLGSQVKTLQQQQAPIAAQIKRLEQERDAATNRLALVRDANGQWNQDKLELLRLRGEIGVLKQSAKASSSRTAQVNQGHETDNPDTQRPGDDEVIPRGHIQLLDASFAVALEVYTNLSPVQVEVEDAIFSLPIRIRLINTNAVSHSEAIALFDEAFREQAGNEVTHPTPDLTVLRLRH